MYIYASSLLGVRTPVIELRAHPNPVWASQVVLVVKNLPANAGDIKDMGLIPGSGRFSGGGHGNPLHYSCLESPLDRGAWRATVHGVTKSRTWLKWLRTHTVIQYEFILIISAETFFPIRLHSEVPGRHEFWGTVFNLLLSLAIYYWRIEKAEDLSFQLLNKYKNKDWVSMYSGNAKMIQYPKNPLV